MFKVSIPKQRVKTFTSWLDVFDQFCEYVKDEDILEKYSQLLEGSGVIYGFESFLDGTQKCLQDVKFILEGSKDHKTITCTIEGKTQKGEKEMFKFFVIDEDDLNFLTTNF